MGVRVNIMGEFLLLKKGNLIILVQTVRKKCMFLSFYYANRAAVYYQKLLHDLYKRVKVYLLSTKGMVIAGLFVPDSDPDMDHSFTCRF